MTGLYIPIMEWRRFGFDQHYHPASAYLDEEQNVPATQEDRVETEETAGQQPVGLSAQERRSRGVRLLGRWATTVDAQDPPHGRLPQPITQTQEVTVHSPISPPAVLARKPVISSRCSRLSRSALRDLGHCETLGQ